MDHYTRFLTDAERARVSGRRTFQSVRWWSGIVSGLCCGAFAWLAVLFVASFDPDPPPWVLPAAWTVAAVATLAWYFFIQARGRRQDKIRRGRQASFLARGKVAVTRYQVSDAVLLEEGEDEGPTYFLALSDGKTLVLQGQVLYEPEEQGFPWAAFEVVHEVAEGPMLWLNQEGPQLPQPARLGAWPDWVPTSVLLPEGETVTQLDFARLKATAAV